MESGGGEGYMQDWVKWKRLVWPPKLNFLNGDNSESNLNTSMSVMSHGKNFSNSTKKTIKKYYQFKKRSLVYKYKCRHKTGV